MRRQLGAALNTFAWAVILLVVAAGIALTWFTGPLGLVIVGGLASLVCTLAALDDDVPTWGPRAFSAYLKRDGSPEERAGRQAAQRANLTPFRFYGRCGLFVAAVGAAGVAWQVWQASGH